MGRCFVFLFILFYVFWLIPEHVLALPVNPVNFLLINGTKSDPNPLKLSGLGSSFFPIPDAFARDYYPVNSPVNFLVSLPDLADTLDIENPVKTSDFTLNWNFDDGASASGYSAQHVFKTSGSHLFFIDTTYTHKPDTDLVYRFTFQINISSTGLLPAIPQPYILVNGRPVYNPQNYQIPVANDKPVSFTAIDTAGAGTEGNRYIWDFGDGISATGPEAVHIFTHKNVSAVLLRVTNTEGFIGDNFAGIVVSPVAGQPASSVKDINPPIKLLIVVTGLSAIVVMTLAFFSRRQ